MKRKIPEDGRKAAINRILSIAKLIRKQGTADEAAEALECERWLQNRLAQMEQSHVAKAA
jgi:hypothetical protein